MTTTKLNQDPVASIGPLNVWAPWEDDDRPYPWTVSGDLRHYADTQGTLGDSLRAIAQGTLTNNEYGEIVKRAANFIELDVTLDTEISCFFGYAKTQEEAILLAGVACKVSGNSLNSPVEPASYIMLLNDGETFTDLNGCSIVGLAEGLNQTEDIEEAIRLAGTGEAENEADVGLVTVQVFGVTP